MVHVRRLADLSQGEWGTHLRHIDVSTLEDLHRGCEYGADALVRFAGSRIFSRRECVTSSMQRIQSVNSLVGFK
jgi:hypothetical protein